MLQSFPELNGAIIGDSRRRSGHPLGTGHTFDIFMRTEEANNMKVMIDIQWAMIRLAAISGVARAWKTDDYDDISSGRV